MPGISGRRRFLKQLLMFSVPTFGAGCGTILYPERRGQPAGCIDWKVVSLDGIGLLFFFVPGVVAFAVDFNNGTIYLPPGECADGDPVNEPELTAVPLPAHDFEVATLERTVSEHVKTEVRLEPGRYQTHSLVDLQQFWAIEKRCRAEA